MNKLAAQECSDVNEAKTSRPELRGRGRGQFLEVKAKAEAKNNYEWSSK